MSDIYYCSNNKITNIDIVVDIEATMNIRKLSPELAEKAYKDLDENSDCLQNNINSLRCWIENQPHLISRTDDQFLLTFLRRCNFNFEESKKRIEAFLTCKANDPDIFKHRAVDSKALEILKSGLVTIPPKPLPNSGPRILISHFSNAFKDVVRVRFMFFELLAFEDDISSISGVELVFDLKNCSLSQAFYLEPSVLKKIFVYQEESIPLKINHIHIINMNKKLQGIVQWIRSFVSTSESSIEVLLHENESDLYKYIPQESMPVVYGGENGTEEEFLEEWEKILLDHAKYFENDSVLGLKEKIEQKPNRLDLVGSFKKLEVD